MIGRRSDSPPPLHHASKRKSNGEPLDISESRSVHETEPTANLVYPYLLARVDTTGQPSAVFPFLRLPAELRDIIYSDVLTLRPNPSPEHRYNIDGTAHTSILRTCRQVWEEASRFLYSNEMTILVHGGYVYYGAEPWSDPVSEDGYCEDPGRWALPPVPAYLLKCKSFLISLEIETWETEFGPDFVEESALGTITNLNSLVYTILLRLQSLQSIHFVLSIEGEATPEEARLSDRFMLSFEWRCLETLGRFQGLKEANLEGFNFANPVYIASVEQQMLLPRSQN